MTDKELLDRIEQVMINKWNLTIKAEQAIAELKEIIKEYSPKQIKLF